ncbi:uncharacterized protein PG998_002974 [Apiospora kogelbergensis]|uniref:uncharacterized protein n=1 Tax=Apiospora kogelbergensis TaxID=1337665 RepID=UPI003130800B
MAGRSVRFDFDCFHKRGPRVPERLSFYHTVPAVFVDPAFIDSAEDTELSARFAAVAIPIYLQHGDACLAAVGSRCFLCDGAAGSPTAPRRTRGRAGRLTRPSVCRRRRRRRAQPPLPTPALREAKRKTRQSPRRL